MKNMLHKFIPPSFLSGFLLAVFVFMAWSFVIPGYQPSKTGEPDPTITIAEANAFFLSYFTKATPIPANTVLKGIVIDKDQLNAMNSLVSGDPSINTFRLYFGRDSLQIPVALVVGVDGNGNDMTGTIYKSTLNRMGPCPSICDSNSPITRQ